jgi:hypothetical protein
MEIWPNFFIIGAMRAGTTSLYEYLKQIPEIYMSPVKELNYFSVNVNPTILFSKPIKTKNEYLQLFKNVKNESVIGEASPSYLWDPMAAELIHKEIPNAKIIIILRNPISRSFSHYLLLKSKGEDNLLSFREEMQKGSENKNSDFSARIFEAGLYSKQVEKYLQKFGSEHVKIFIFEEFFKDINSSLKKVLEFLELKSDLRKISLKTHNYYSIPRDKFSKNILKSEKIKNIGKKIIPYEIGEYVIKKILTKQAKKPIISSEDYQFVKKLYFNDVQNLKKIIGRDLPWGFD